MTVESDLFGLIGESLLKLSDGSILLLGLISFVALMIIVQRFNIGFAPATMLSAFILATLSLSFDSSVWGNIQLPFSIFNLLFTILIIGVAWLFAQTLYRQR